MKTIWFTLLLAGGATAALAQNESDDMYFTAADRQREISARPRTTRALDGPSEEAQTAQQAAFDGFFTGRSVNPDYDPSVSTTGVDYSYFDSNYNSAASMMSSYNSYRQGNYPNSSFGNGWNNSWNYGYGYGAGRFGYNPFYDPFNQFGFGGFNNPWNNFGYGANPYSGWRSGWTITTMYGNGGWYGMNPYHGFNNFYGYNSFGGGYYSGLNPFFNPYANYAYGYDSRPKLTYGKRPSRSSDFNNDAREQARRYTIQSSGNAPRATSGRSSASTTRNNYYQRGWRQDPSINPRVPGEVSNGYSGGRGSSWSQHQSSSWGSSDFGGRSSGFSSGGSRSSSGGSGFSGGSSQGSSGGRRGRD